MDANQLAGLATQFNCNCQAEASIEKAIDTAMEKAGSEAVVLVTGSIFVAAAARDIWFDRKKQTAPAEEPFTLIEPGRKFG